MLAISMACGVCYALIEIAERGTWPDSWPKELEPYRDQARTLGVATGIQETVYEIPFDSREEFEKAWPHILKLKSKGSRLILEKSPSRFCGLAMATGVRILWPSAGFSELPDGTRLQAAPPWPDSIKFASGELPEYVMHEGGQWVPFTSGRERKGFLHRARVDIMLVTDGQVVDLNRIELPGETPILDRRFKK